MGAFRDVVLEHGEADMARRLNIAVSTLSNKVQPYDHEDRRHYLNFYEADSILSLTGDMRPLELLAARHGYVLLPLNALAEASCFEAEALQDVQALVEYHQEKDPLMAVHRLHETIRGMTRTHAARFGKEVAD